MPARPTTGPRRSDDPVPDLTDYVVVHRAMTVDTRRLAQAAARVGDRPRAAAMRTYLAGLSSEIRNHHHVEDHAAWPLILSAAGPEAAALAALTDDHHRLDPLLDDAERIAAELVERPTDEDVADRLAATLDQLAMLLDQHVADEEREVFPLIRAHVAESDYAWLQQQFRRGLTLRALPFVVPWVVRHAAPDELPRLVGDAGWPLRVVLRMFRGRFAALEQRVFG
jgi:iron-sulfur cluster repair protein YtfE (RIC family)